MDVTAEKTFDAQIDDLLWFIRWKKATHYWFNVSPSRDEFEYAKNQAEKYKEKIKPLVLKHVEQNDDNILHASMDWIT